MPSFLRSSHVPCPSLVAVAFLLTTLSACGSSSQCPAGSAKCPCYGNETCNTGLSCASGLCVNLGGQTPLDAASDVATPASTFDSAAPPLFEVGDSMADPTLATDTSISGVDGSDLRPDGGGTAPPDLPGADTPRISGTVCGDGIVLPPEQCDDGNAKAGDGCSQTCRVEIGYKCERPGQPCTATICGDGKKEGAETCDDGNNMPFDGCSTDCQIEPKCTVDGGCVSQCGDHIVLGEECDDGNNVDGDGCSKDCKIEAGWTCSQPPIGDTMKVPVIYRDFRFQQPTDFEGSVTGSYNSVSGIVAAALNIQGKPVYSGLTSAGVHIASADSFSQWYTNVASVNHSTVTKMTLWSDGKSNYVNRYGANGEQWNITTSANWCGTVVDAMLDADGKPIPCTFKPQASLDGGSTVGMTDCQKMEAKGYTMLPNSCKADTSGIYKALYVVGKVDGNPLFFPVDNDTFTPASELRAATIPPYYDASATWPFDVDADGAKRLHNFGFTTEIRHWFRYDKTKTYALDFVGDDDVWVFINGRLVADLGGIHIAVDGNVVIGSDGNATTTVTPTYPVSPAPTARTQAAALGLQDGKIYEIAIFQAERQSNASSLKVTLPPFTMVPSECTPL